MKKIIGKAANAFVVLICHFALASILIVSFHYVEELIRYLGSGEVEMIFGAFPLDYLFQAVDVTMIGLFGVMGVKEAYEVLR